MAVKKEEIYCIVPLCGGFRDLSKGFNLLAHEFPNHIIEEHHFEIRKDPTRENRYVLVFLTDESARKMEK